MANATILAAMAFFPEEESPRAIKTATAEMMANNAVINKLLVQGGLDVYALHPQQNDLEQLFLDITSTNS